MKQSVYLSEAEHARWKALGVTLGDVVRAGLAALEAPKDRPISGEGTLSAAAVFVDRAALTGTGTLTATVTMTCVTCGEPVRRPGPGDGLDPRDYEWTHASGNPICDGPPTAWPRTQEGTQQ
jgi:hypothetical protein